MLKCPDMLNLAKKGPGPDQTVVKSEAEWRAQLRLEEVSRHAAGGHRARVQFADVRVV